MARPREFDRDDALRAALKVFWSKGYDGASFRDLETEMGLSRSSMVAAFKDKQSLFEEALALYVKEYSEPRFKILREAPSTREGILAFLSSSIESSISGKCPAGCFIVNSAVGVNGLDSKIHDFVEKRLKIREQELFNLLERGQKSGEIRKDMDIRATSRTLQALSLGMSALTKVNKSKAYYEGLIQEALRILN